MTCERCGADLLAGSDRCTVCGLALPVANPWTTAPPESTTPAGPWPGPAAPQAPPTQPAGAPPFGVPQYSPPAPYGVPAYGAPYGYYPGTMPLPTNGLAIASLVCGIVGGCLCVVWIPAIVMGFFALNQIKATGDRQPGRGMALAGITLGCIWAVLTVSYVVLFFSNWTSASIFLQATLP